MGTPRLLKTGLVDVTCGEGVTIVEPANCYGCTLGDKVFVGPFVEIQRDVTIGARTRVQSHTFIQNAFISTDAATSRFRALFVESGYEHFGHWRGG